MNARRTGPHDFGAPWRNDLLPTEEFMAARLSLYGPGSIVGAIDGPVLTEDQTVRRQDGQERSD